MSAPTEKPVTGVDKKDGENYIALESIPAILTDHPLLSCAEGWEMVSEGKSCPKQFSVYVAHDRDDAILDVRVIFEHDIPEVPEIICKLNKQCQGIWKSPIVNVPSYNRYCYKIMHRQRKRNLESRTHNEWHVNTIWTMGKDWRSLSEDDAYCDTETMRSNEDLKILDYDSFVSHVVHLASTVSMCRLREHLLLLNQLKVPVTLSENWFVRSRASKKEFIGMVAKKVKETMGGGADLEAKCIFATASLAKIDFKGHAQDIERTLACLMVNRIAGADKSRMTDVTIAELSKLMPVLFNNAMHKEGLWGDYIVRYYPFFSKIGIEHYLDECIPFLESENYVDKVIKHMYEFKALEDADILLCEIFKRLTTLFSTNDNSFVALQNKVLKLEPIALLLYAKNVFMRSLSTEFFKSNKFEQNVLERVRSRLFNDHEDFSSVRLCSAIWHCIKRDPFLASDEAIKDYICYKIRELVTSDVWQPIEDEIDDELLSFEKLTKDRSLFDIERGLPRLVSGIVRSKSDAIRDICFNMFQSIPPSETLDMAIITWCKTEANTVINTHNITTSKKLKKIYKTMFALRELTCISNIDTTPVTLDKVATKTVGRLGVDDLLEQVTYMETLDERYQIAFGEHLKCAIEVVGASPSLIKTRTINSRLAAVPVLTVLGKQTIPDVLDVNNRESVELLLSILKNRRFWLNVLSADGQHSGDVSKHEVTKRVRNVIELFSNMICGGEIAFHFASQLVPMMASKEAVELFGTTGTLHWSATIHELEIKINHTNVVMEQLLLFKQSYIDTLCNEKNGMLCDQEQFCDGLNKLKMKLTNDDSCKTKHLKDDDFWGTFKDTVEYIAKLEGLTGSEVFLRFCETFLVEKVTAEAMKTNIKTPPTDVLPHYEAPAYMKLEPSITKKLTYTVFAEVLATTALHGLKQLNDAFHYGFDVSAKSIHGMFANIKHIKSEVNLIERYFKNTFPEKSSQALIGYGHFEFCRTVARYLRIMQESFKVVPNDEEPLQRAIICILKCDDLTIDMSLFELSGHIRRILSLGIESFLMSVIKKLCESRDLLTFLTDNTKEDFRNLVDAVGEHYESVVQINTVLQLIEVKSFLQPVLEIDSNPFVGVGQLLDRLKECCSAVSPEITDKLGNCNEHVEAINDLYTRVSNIGETTKSDVKSIRDATYRFFIECGRCSLQLTSTVNKTTCYTLQDITDLRSRVRLTVNNDMFQTWDDKELMKCRHEFLDMTDEVYPIIEMCTELHKSGHFDYEYFEESVDTIHKMKSLSSLLTCNLAEWRKHLSDARSEFYLLNYVHSNQIRLLYHFFTDAHKIPVDNQEKMQLNVRNATALSILQFINPEISAIELSDYVGGVPDVTKSKDKLYFIGSQLTSIFAKKRPRHRLLVNTQDDIADRVITGEPYIVKLQPECTSVIPTVMQLYASTTNALPEAHQILFCSSNTRWNEIHLLLNRCLLQSASRYRKTVLPLFCIANVELLQNNLQFALVDELNALVSSNGNSEYILSILCIGSDCPILDSFPQLTHIVRSMLHNDVANCLQQVCPDVSTYTSAVPGLGKTETILKTSQSLRKSVVHFPVGGSFNKATLTERLHRKSMTSDDLLHLDVSDIDKPFQFDLFVFELTVLGNVSSGSTQFMLPSTNVAIEIANSLNHSLRDSLSCCSFFKKQFLEWKNYDDYIPSCEITSADQVVCHYLKAMDESRIDVDDIYFAGKRVAKPLSGDECRRLLREHFPGDVDMSFSSVKSSIGVLADQLKKLSASTFFRTSALEQMTDEHVGIKNSLIGELLDMCKAFTNASVTKCLETQSESISLLKMMDLKVTADAMIKRTDGMIRWDESNHLLILFHSNGFSSVTAVYRSLTRVPWAIKKLFETQLQDQLRDYNTFDEEELQGELRKIVVPSQLYHQPFLLPNDYTLTPDNFLKMVLIFLRIKARIPVIIMGETGCGKTSLIKYLAQICKCNFEVFNFHASVGEVDIISRVTGVNKTAEKRPTESFWLFLDEINTCRHLGLIKEIMCQRSMAGNELAPNLILLAACNPYRARTDKQILTAGIKGKAKTDEIWSRLVYRVHPLPETLVGYVWDFGSLLPADESAYIERIVRTIYGKKSDMLVELLTKSQDFTRNEEETSWCVSLRDVSRCIALVKWFESDYLEKRSSTKQTFLFLKSTILGLAHCYNSRLGSADSRKKYHSKMAECMKKYGEDVSAEAFKEIIQAEQQDLLNRMVLPENIAKNEALCENVFVTLVCILNRIPIFLVGKPGCSKSLALQLIRSNLCGSDSKDDFFRRLPKLFVVSYQCSVSATSEGIEKVFKKAKDCLTDSKSIPVVLLDEIGLAEQAPLDPLKVLHSVLDSRKVAVVGISNWALDAAKMNRVIHLCRPEPDVEDLYYTAKSICSKTLNANNDTYQGESKHIPDDHLKHIAGAFADYVKRQSINNFHGLRDYYSLIKYVWKECDSSSPPGYNVWKRGILRNFGGLKFGTRKVAEKFLRFMEPPGKCYPQISVEELIQNSVSDLAARHLMLITSGTSALGILDTFIELPGKSHELIFGSKFEEDMSEDYNYRILNQIIFCMSQGVLLILKDLDNIYGSLYDMLNQDYTKFGKEGRKNCRIALGQHSNPICEVHDNFKCIVIIDHTNVDFTDPPFLNRFEKHRLTFKSVLSKWQTDLAEKLESYVKSMCTIIGYEGTFEIEHAVKGFHEDTIPSLILYVSKRWDSVLHEEEAIGQCMRELLWVFSPDAIIRASKSKLAESHAKDVSSLQSHFFDLPIHKGITYLIEEALRDTDIREIMSGDGIGIRAIIHTRSNITFDVYKALRGVTSVQVEKLCLFKSEKQLRTRMHHFWFQTETDLFVLQCDPSSDAKHMLLAKSLIDKSRGEYRRKHSSKVKHALLIIHVGLQHTPGWQFNYLSGWKLVTIDSLEPGRGDIPLFLGKTVGDSLRCDTLFNFKEIILNNILWAFSFIQYSGTPRLKKSISSIKNTLKETDISEAISKVALRWIDKKYPKRECDTFSPECWQVVLCSDAIALQNSSTVVDAFISHLQMIFCEPLAMIVFQLEKCHAWTSYSDTYQHIWNEIFLEQTFFCINDLRSYRDVGFYRHDNVCLDLSFPFSAVFIKMLNEFRDLFLDWYTNLGEDAEVKPDAYSAHQNRFAALLFDRVPDLFRYIEDAGSEDFLNDFCDIVSASHALQLNDRRQITRWAINACQERIDNAGAKQVVQLVTNYWARENSVRNILHLLSICNNIPGCKITDVVYSVQNMMDKQFSSATPTPTDVMTPDDCLVAVVCKAMLPNRHVIGGGIVKWQETLSLVLSFAGKVSPYPGIIHFLRVCRDFVAKLLIPSKLHGDSNFSPFEEAAKLDENALASMDLFKSVLTLLKRLVNQEKTSLLCAQWFLCKYLDRCCDFDSQHEALLRFFYIISERPVLDPDFHYVGVLIERVWYDGIEDHLAFCRGILGDQETVKESPITYDLARTVAQCTDERHYPFLILVCDVIEHSLLRLFSKHTASDRSQCMELLDIAKTACEVQKSTFSFQQVVAIAFLKAYVRLLVGELRTKKQQFVSGTTNNEFLQEVSSLVQIVTGNEGPVAQFLFKVLHVDLTFKEIRVFCNEYIAKMPVLQNVCWMTDDYSNPLGYRPMANTPGYHTAVDCYFSLLKGDVRQFLGIATKTIHSPEKRFDLLSMLADTIFLVATNRCLKPTEHKAAQDICNQIHDTSLPQAYKYIVKHLTLQAQFKEALLDLHVGSPVVDIQKSSVIVHLVCLIVSYSDFTTASKFGQYSCLLAKALYDPECIQKVHNPKPRPLDKVQSDLAAVSIVECMCWNKLVTKEDFCSICGSDNSSMVKTRCMGPAAEPSGSLTSQPGKTSLIYHNVLQLLINGCILANFGSSDHSRLAVARKQFNKSWQILKETIHLPDQQFVCFLHGTIDELKERLTDIRAFPGLDEDPEWETEFRREVDNLVARRHALVLKNKMETLEYNKTLKSFEARVDELVPSEPGILPLLFRFTPNRSTNSILRAYRLNEQQNKHPFLEMFFNSLHKLKLLSYLQPLLRWQQVIKANKGHIITRREARTHTVDQIFEVQSAIRGEFQRFCKAWEKLMYLKESLPGVHGDLENMQLINEDLPLIDSLATDEQSIMFKVIEALVRVHNDFLEAVLKIAVSTKCDALGFLNRGSSTATVQMVPLHEANTDHILQNPFEELEDELARFSQFNTKYGMGYDIQYDFDVIEMELANRLIFGRAHLLLDEKFPFFPFACELPSYGSVLKHVQRILPQEDLPSQVEASIKAMRKSDASIVLNHVDVVLRMLQRPQGRNLQPTQLFKDYADRWYLALGKQFPVDLLPQSALGCELKHTVALYCQLEKVLICDIEDKLPMKYRQQLDDAVKTELLQQLDTNVDLTRLQTVLRRFIFRYMTTKDDSMPDKGQSIISHLKALADDANESQQSKQLSDVFKPNIYLCHVYTVAKIVYKLIKGRAETKVPVPTLSRGNPTQPRRRFVRRT